MRQQYLTQILLYFNLYLESKNILNNTFTIITSWWPWFYGIDDIFLLQVFVLYTILIIFKCNSVYYALLYTFLNFFLLGVVLAIFQVELFTAFLWLVECSVLFIFLLLLFYVNVKGFSKNLFCNIQNILIVMFLLFLTNIILLIPKHGVGLNLNLIYENIFSAIDNYYESVYNPINNDLVGLFLSFYTINHVELIIVGFILLVGSVVCITLYNLNRSTREQNYSSYLHIFDFFNDLNTSSFIRRQNIVKQGNAKANTKIFKKI